MGRFSEIDAEQYEEDNKRYTAFVPIPSSVTVEVWASSKEEALERIKEHKYKVIDSNSDSGDRDPSGLTVEDIMDMDY